MGKSELFNGGFDIPTEFTSSIGAVVWPPVETNNERLKGVYPNVIETGYDLLNFLSKFSLLEFSPKATRISARLVTSNEALRDLIQSNLPFREFIETIIPLADCQVVGLEDCCLIYVGKNDPSRKTPEDIIEQQLKAANEIFSKFGIQGNSNKKIPDGFKIEFLDKDKRRDSTILEMYNELYSLFNWSTQDVKKMLSNQNNLIIAAFNKEGKVVSSAIAEFGEMTFVRKGQPATLSLVEITEAATLPAYRGMGTYQAVSDGILKYLAEHKKPPNLVFGELNLDAPGVLKVAAKQGRIPAIQTAQEYGLFPRGWFLEQHVVIYQGDNQERPDNYPYNNLMVAFLPKNLLMEKYGRKNS